MKAYRITAVMIISVIFLSVCSCSNALPTPDASELTEAVRYAEAALDVMTGIDVRLGDQVFTDPDTGVLFTAVHPDFFATKEQLVNYVTEAYDSSYFNAETVEMMMFTNNMSNGAPSYKVIDGVLCFNTEAGRESQADYDMATLTVVSASEGAGEVTLVSTDGTMLRTYQLVCRVLEGQEDVFVAAACIDMPITEVE